LDLLFRNIAIIEKRPGCVRSIDLESILRREPVRKAKVMKNC
jgi:hypothetical protein